MKLVCLELSFDAAGRSAADNPPVQIIAPLKSIFRSVTERSGEKNRFQFLRSISLPLFVSLYLSTRVYIYFRLSELFREPSFHPTPDSIYKKRIETRNATLYAMAPLRGVSSEHAVFGTHVWRSVSEAKFKYFSADGTTHPRLLRNPPKIRSAPCPRLPDVKYKAIS